MGRLKGCKLTEEHKRKIGLAGKGRKMSDEWKEKLIKRLKGNKNWLGKHHTKETKRKMSLAAKGEKFTEEHKRNLSKAKKGKPNLLKGSLSPSWKGGRTIDKGYVYIKNRIHPYCNQQGYVSEHRLTVEKYLGRYLKSPEECHHLNGNHSDNRIQNLMVFVNHSSHRRFEMGKQKVKSKEIIFDGR